MAVAYGERFQVELGAATEAIAGSMTIGTVFDMWADYRDNGSDSGWSPSNAANQRMFLTAAADYFGHDTPIANIKPGMIGLFCNHLRARGVKESTVHRYLSAIKPAFGYAVGEGLITANPVQKRYIPKVDKADKQIPAYDAAVVAFRAASETPMWAMFLYLTSLLAARRGEILGLRFSDLDGNTLTMRGNVVAAKGGAVYKVRKNRRAVRFPLKDRDVKAWHDWHQYVANQRQAAGATMPEDGFLFTLGDDLEQHIHPRTAGRWWEKIRDANPELDGITLHAFRHYGATFLANNPELSPRAAQKWLDHSSVTTTEGYAHGEDELMTAASSAMSEHISDLLAGVPLASTPEEA